MTVSARQWMLLVAVTIVTGVGVLLSSCSTGVDAGSPARTDLEGVVTGFAAGLKADGPYRPPTTAERQQFLTALHPVLGDALVADPSGVAAAVRDLGFSADTGTDPATGRKYLVVTSERDSERAWGLYLVDLSRPVRLGVEVPHPNSDLVTERIGLALFRAVPGSVLLVAGAHRRAAQGAGDVAHRADSMFHAVAEGLAERDFAQVQVHGFHDDSLPDADVVISPGAGQPGALIRAMASAVADADLEVCRSWEDKCGALEGTRNQQGKASAERGSVFVHLEISRTVRDDKDRWTGLVRAVADTVP